MSEWFRKHPQDKCSGLTLIDWARKMQTSEEIPPAQRLDENDVTGIQSFSTWADTNRDEYLSQAEHDVTIASWKTRLSGKAQAAITTALTVCDGKIKIGE